MTVRAGLVETVRELLRAALGEEKDHDAVKLGSAACLVAEVAGVTIEDGEVRGAPEPPEDERAATEQVAREIRGRFTDTPWGQQHDFQQQRWCEAVAPFVRKLRTAEAGLAAAEERCKNLDAMVAARGDALERSQPTCTNADCEWCAHDLADARNGQPHPPTCPTASLMAPPSPVAWATLRRAVESACADTTNRAMGEVRAALDACSGVQVVAVRRDGREPMSAMAAPAIDALVAKNMVAKLPDGKMVALPAGTVLWEDQGRYGDRADPDREEQGRSLATALEYADDPRELLHHGRALAKLFGVSVPPRERAASLPPRSPEAWVRIATARGHLRALDAILTGPVDEHGLKAAADKIVSTKAELDAALAMSEPSAPSQGGIGHLSVVWLYKVEGALRAYREMLHEGDRALLDGLIERVAQASREAPCETCGEPLGEPPWCITKGGAVLHRAGAQRRPSWRCGCPVRG